MSSPFFWVAFASLRKIEAILARALAVAAMFSHSGCTFCEREVSISTWSPLLSLWLNGTNR